VPSKKTPKELSTKKQELLGEIKQKVTYLMDVKGLKFIGVATKIKIDKKDKEKPIDQSNLHGYLYADKQVSVATLEKILAAMNTGFHYELAGWSPPVYIEGSPDLHENPNDAPPILQPSDINFPQEVINLYVLRNIAQTQGLSPKDVLDGLEKTKLELAQKNNPQ
jgi:hypothetical protein